MASVPLLLGEAHAAHAVGGPPLWYAMLATLEDIHERVTALYTANAGLRRKQERVLDVRHSRNRVYLPPSMRKRANVIHVGIADEKVERAKTLMMDEGPRVSVSTPGLGRAAQNDRDKVRNWLQGGIQACEERNPDGIEGKVNEDLLVHSEAWVLSLPLAEIWGEMPQLHIDDVDDFSEANQKKLDQRVARAERDQDRYKNENFPIHLEWIPDTSVLWDKDIFGGVNEVFQIQTVTVSEVLKSYKDKDGNSKAVKLKHAISEENTLTPADMVTLVTRADRTHLQISVIGMMVDISSDDRPDRRTHGAQDEILWEGRHGLRDVPYTRFRGRETTAPDPRYRLKGFLDEAIEMCESLDNAVTQNASTVKQVAWPGLYIKKTQPGASTFGKKDSPPKFVLTEGAVSDGLRAGETVENPSWTNTNDFRLQAEFITFLVNRINSKTLSETTMGGTGGAESGYMFAQIQAAAEGVLKPFIDGAKAGWTKVCKKMLQCAEYLMEEHDFDAIPVRHITEQRGVEFVVLPLRLAQQQWDISVQVRVGKVGGEMAQIQVLSARKAEGWLTDIQALEILGDPNPTQTRRQVLMDKVMDEGALIQTIAQAVQARVLRALQQQAEDTMVREPMVSGAMMAAFDDPMVRARGPEGTEGGPTDGQLGGLPSPRAGNMAPPPPTLTDKLKTAVATRAGGGNPAGEALATPGGTIRQSDVAARFATTAGR